MTTGILDINTRFLARSPHQVRIVRAESPSLFWVQLHTAQDDFEELLDDLHRRMTRRGHQLRCLPHNVQLDEAVAIRESKGWQRGQIIQIRGDGTATIALKDWGRVVERSFLEIYLLHDRFRQLEWQAIPCKLACTEPEISTRGGPQVGARQPGTTKVWSRGARSFTKNLIENREGWITIKGRENGKTNVKLEIRNESGTATLDLKEVLKYLGHAR